MWQICDFIPVTDIVDKIANQALYEGMEVAMRRSEQVERVDELAAMVADIQQRLFMFHVTYRDREIMPVLADLLAAVDIAKRDLHWVRKDLLTPDIERWEHIGD